MLATDINFLMFRTRNIAICQNDQKLTIYFCLLSTYFHILITFLPSLVINLSNL